MAKLHIIEPTLADQAGHCHGYVQGLIEANQQVGYRLHVWLDKRGHHLYANEDCEVHPYFNRQLRQWQKLFCLRRLFNQQEIMFIPTAQRIDLIYLTWLLRQSSRKYQQKFFLHFHQFKINSKKEALLKKIAQHQENFVILAPTQGLLDIFQQAGFMQGEKVPCPGYSPTRANQSRTEPVFNKVIYAGAARADKGFPELVAFVEYLAAQSVTLPLEIQVSPPFSGRYDEKSQQALKQLKKLSLPSVILHEKTLEKETYQNLFCHAICLLIYDPSSYRDKFSGVTLDAFYAGCPVISVEKTWAGDMTERFQAGVVLANRSAENVWQALQHIRENYLFYTKNAQRAGEVLRREHDPINTLRAIEKYAFICGES